jgi:hypothetical protein
VAPSLVQSSKSLEGRSESDWEPLSPWTQARSTTFRPVSEDAPLQAATVGK